MFMLWPYLGDLCYFFYVLLITCADWIVCCVYDKGTLEEVCGNCLF